MLITDSGRSNGETTVELCLRSDLDTSSSLFHRSGLGESLPLSPLVSPLNTQYHSASPISSLFAPASLSPPLYFLNSFLSSPLLCSQPTVVSPLLLPLSVISTAQLPFTVSTSPLPHCFYSPTFLSSHPSFIIVRVPPLFSPATFLSS